MEKGSSQASEKNSASAQEPDGASTGPNPLFRALDPSNLEEVEMNKVESLCMSCGETVDAVDDMERTDQETTP